MTERHDLRIIAGISIKHYLRFVWLLLAFAAPVQAAVSERILLQASPLAGFQYHAGKQVWGELHEGDALELVREADNVYDPRAVRVLWHGTMLGYVPRRDNEAVARLLDRGTPLEARITRLVKTRNPWQRILFEVYLPL
jgi:hypothetical protein